jgi:hypothetical protein
MLVGIIYEYLFRHIAINIWWYFYKIIWFFWDRHNYIKADIPGPLRYLLITLKPLQIK